MASFATGHYPAPRGFSYATREPRSGEKVKISGYVGLESHFHVDASCQTRQIDIYKRDSNAIIVSCDNRKSCRRPVESMPATKNRTGTSRHLKTS